MFSYLLFSIKLADKKNENDWWQENLFFLGIATKHLFFTGHISKKLSIS